MLHDSVGYRLAFPPDSLQPSLVAVSPLSFVAANYLFGYGGDVWVFQVQSFRRPIERGLGRQTNTVDSSLLLADSFTVH